MEALHDELGGGSRRGGAGGRNRAPQGPGASWVARERRGDAGRAEVAQDDARAAVRGELALDLALDVERLGSQPGERELNAGQLRQRLQRFRRQAFAIDREREQGRRLILDLTGD